jgi:PAS domain S-box-containing protein
MRMEPGTESPAGFEGRMDEDKGKTRPELLAEVAKLRRRLEGMEKLEAERRRTGAALEECGELERTSHLANQEALRESRELFRSFFDSAAAGMAILGLDGKPQEVNPAFCRFLGYERAELLSRGFLQVTHPEEVEESRRIYIEILSGRLDEVDHERRFVRKDGAEVWGHVRGTWLHDSNARPTNWVTVVEDITARKRAEFDLKRALAEAQDSRDKIDNIIAAMSGGLMVADPGGRVVLVNQAVQRLLRVSMAEILGQSLTDIFQDRFFQERLQEMMGSQLSGFQTDLEMPLPGVDAARVIRTRASLMQNQQGRITGAVTILHDVTRERELDRMKSEFISTAAHELHTPLASLMGYAELLLHPEEFGEFPAERQKEFLGEIYDKCEALARIVDDLLDISRIEAGGEIPLEKLPTDFRRMVEKVVDRFRIHCPNHSFELNLGTGGTDQILMDENKMVQVLENLLSNAVKYSPAGGSVRVEGRVAGDVYRISVIDRGIGMTGEQVAKVFEKFYRADSSNTAVPGLGLGMSIARNIVEAHGGDIRVESSPGHGTEVIVAVPLIG